MIYELAERMGYAVSRATGCWLWLGAINGKGYGQFSTYIDKKISCVKAHRYFYEKANGAIKGGMQIDHLCRNRLCVNPLHLEEVTSEENNSRGIKWNSLKTHCHKGHAFDEQNTGITKDKKRRCRKCVNEYMRNRYNQKGSQDEEPLPPARIIPVDLTKPRSK